MDENNGRSIGLRHEAIRNWLVSQAPFVAAEQKHLDAGSSEQAYWHFGYLAALADMMDLETTGAGKSGIADRSSPSQAAGSGAGACKADGNREKVRTLSRRPPAARGNSRI